METAPVELATKTPAVLPYGRIDAGAGAAESGTGFLLDSVEPDFAFLLVLFRSDRAGLEELSQFEQGCTWGLRRLRLGRHRLCSRRFQIGPDRDQEPTDRANQETENETGTEPATAFTNGRSDKT